MKKLSKYVLLLSSLMTIPLESGAVEFERDNLVYDLDQSALTASVVGFTEKSAGSTMILTIPDTLEIGYDKYAVKRILEDAFANEKQLMSVSIPETVTSIGKKAFSECSMLSPSIYHQVLQRLNTKHSIIAIA